jgi:hypothetical protein
MSEKVKTKDENNNETYNIKDFNNLLENFKLDKLLNIFHDFKLITYAEYDEYTKNKNLTLEKYLRKLIDKNASYKVLIYYVSGDYYTINDLATIALQVTGHQDWKIKYIHPELDGQYRKDVSIEKLKTYFPHFNFISLKEGIQKIYNQL